MRRRRAVESVRQYAGVGDQSDSCRHGTVGCPGETVGDELPCFSCLSDSTGCGGQ
jgi:hypothetical protein